MDMTMMNPADVLHERGFVHFAHQVRKCDRTEPLPDFPGFLTEHDERDKSIPTPMFKTVSQISPMPRFAACPPNPIMAEVEINVAPYESAIIDRVAVPSGNKVILGVLRLSVTHVPNDERCGKVDQDKYRSS